MQINSMTERRFIIIRLTFRTLVILLHSLLKSSRWNDWLRFIIVLLNIKAWRLDVDLDVLCYHRWCTIGQHRLWLVVIFFLVIWWIGLGKNRTRFVVVFLLVVLRCWEVVVLVGIIRDLGGWWRKMAGGVQ